MPVLVLLNVSFVSEIKEYEGTKLLQDQLLLIKQQLQEEQAVTISLPSKFRFKDHDVHDFDSFLEFFDWTLHDIPVRIDLTPCLTANYQALALLVLYAWKLKSQGCRVSFIESDAITGASAMWKNMGARGLFSVLPVEDHRFKGNSVKPLFAIRNSNDFKLVIAAAEKFTQKFNVEYSSTLRYVLGELLYNTMEHGRCYGSPKIRGVRIPSIVQFTWYAKQNEIHFIIADLGIGIKKHLEQAYPGQESDEEAIKVAVKPKISGTFGRNDPYTTKNNAGMGLYISTNIIRRLNADMHVLTGNGLLHVSPRDVTGRTLKNNWPGTIVLVALKIEGEPTFILHKLMQEFRAGADKEQRLADSMESDNRFYLSMTNYFGPHAEDKEAAINYRDTRLFPAINSGKYVVVDFDGVKSAPHSFLSALFASPIKTLGLQAYKAFKFVNTSPEIRETIDFILDDNT